MLTLIALGLFNQEIGGRLSTSRRTVSTRVERLLQKLDQKSRSGLASLAVDSHLVSLPIPGGLDGTAPLSVVIIERFGEMITEGTFRPTQALSTTETPAPILLGTLASLTGQANDEGQELVRGAALAVEEINAGGGILGRPVEHLVVDADLYDADAVRADMQRLIDAEVDAITTHYSSAENPFLLDMAADYGRPFLHLDTFERHVDLVRTSPTRYGTIFQTCPSEKYYSLAFLRFLRELSGLRSGAADTGRISLVELDTPSAHIDANGFADAVERIGWTIDHRVSVPFHDADWSRIVDRIVSSNADIVLVAHFVTDEIVEFRRQLVRRGFSGLTYFVYAASSPRFTELLGDEAEGVVWSSVTSRTDSVIARTFQRDYSMRFGTVPGPTQSSSAYDQVQLLAAAWRQNGGTDSDGVCTILRKNLHRGLNGTYFLGDEGQSPLSYPDGTSDPTIGMPLLTCQIQDGQPVVVSPTPFGSIDRLQLAMRGTPDDEVTTQDPAPQF